MARKTSRRVAVSKRKKSPAAKGRKSSTRQAGGASARSAPTSKNMTVSAENFIRCIRTLHDLGLVLPFVKSAKRAKLTLTMDTAAFERVKKSKGVKPPPDNDPFDFGSNTSPGGLGGVKPLPGHDPFDF